jgi:hypothetical protein
LANYVHRKEGFEEILLRILGEFVQVLGKSGFLALLPFPAKPCDKVFLKDQTDNWSHGIREYRLLILLQSRD